jgi:hypothetical protein
MNDFVTVADPVPFCASQSSDGRAHANLRNGTRSHHPC